MQKRRERDNEENKTKKTVDLVKRIVPAVSLPLQWRKRSVKQVSFELTLT